MGLTGVAGGSLDSAGPARNCRTPAEAIPARPIAMANGPWSSDELRESPCLGPSPGASMRKY